MKYIVVDCDNGCGVGASIEGAYEDYQSYIDNHLTESLAVFECTPIEIEFKIVKKTKPVKVINKPKGKMS